MLKIRTTGLEAFAPGGSARLRAVIIGPGDSGKTRFSSYAPRPFFANCEAGLSSVADRGVPYADVNGSQDMLDVLEFMASECRRAWDQRRYWTLIIDTIDAFERKVKDEWVRQNPSAQTFQGYPAWGYLGSKQQMLLTRLLNLDMNILVLAHHKEKTIREGTGELATERQELSIRLQGETKDTIFDDFDLVGRMGTFWEAVDGQRIEKRGLTFKKTPEWPFLKDRLAMTPPWIEVDFSSDEACQASYRKLFSRLEERRAALRQSEVIGEIPRSDGNGFAPMEPADLNGIHVPGVGGALPPSEPREEPLVSRSKPALMNIAREMGLSGLRGNTLKSELITMIEAAGGLDAWQKIKAAGTKTSETETTLEQAKEDVRQAAEASLDTPPAEDVEEPVEAAAEDPEPEQPAETFTEAQMQAAAAIPQCAVDDGTSLCVFDRNHAGAHSWASPTTDAGEPVNTDTGEIVEAAAVKAVEEGLGGKVAARVPAPAPKVPAMSPPKGVERPDRCPKCGKGINDDPSPDLTGGKPISSVTKESYIRVAWIKHREHMCASCFLTMQRPA